MHVYFVQVNMHVYIEPTESRMPVSRRFLRLAARWDAPMRYTIVEPNPNPTRFPIQPLYGLEPGEADAMHKRMRWELDDAEYFIYVFKPVDRKLIQQFIPPPLRIIPGSPLISVFIQQLTLNGGRGNDSLNYGYLEHIVAALATYKGRFGIYPLAIFIESDIGAMLGRESFGTAKKVAQFEYGRGDDSFSWKVSRRGITLIEASGQFTDTPVDPNNVLKLVRCPSFHLQQIIGRLHGKEYHGYPPRLMEMTPGLREIHSIKACDDVTLAYHESPFDPICLFRPKEILAVTYMNADTSIENTGFLEDMEPSAALPFLFSKHDPF